MVIIMIMAMVMIVWCRRQLSELASITTNLFNIYYIINYLFRILPENVAQILGCFNFKLAQSFRNHNEPYFAKFRMFPHQFIGKIQGRRSRLQTFEPRPLDNPMKKGNCDVTGFKIHHVYADTRQPSARSPNIKGLLTERRAWGMCCKISVWGF